MKVFVELTTLEEKSKELISYSKNNINDQILNLQKAVNDIDWSGPAKEAFDIRYNKLINDLNKFNSNIELFGEYLLFFKNNYGEANDKLMKSWQEYIDTIKVNKEEELDEL